MPQHRTLCSYKCSRQSKANCHFLCLETKKVTKENSRKERKQPVPFVVPWLDFIATVTSAFVFHAYSFHIYSETAIGDGAIEAPLTFTALVQKLNWNTDRKTGCYRFPRSFFVSFGTSKKEKEAEPWRGRRTLSLYYIIYRLNSKSRLLRPSQWRTGRRRSHVRSFH